MIKRICWILLLGVGFCKNAEAQGIPAEVLYEPDEGAIHKDIPLMQNWEPLICQVLPQTNRFDTC